MPLARALLVLLAAACFGLLPPAMHLAGTAQAVSCAVWSADPEDDFNSTNLTASACSSTADDSAAVGVQCPGTPQLRYYPGDDAPANLVEGSKAVVTFAVDPDSVKKTMRYDNLNGVFFVKIKPRDPVFALLQSGGPLVVSGDALGSHKFRLLGSTKAIATVLAGCGVKLDSGAAPSSPAASSEH